MSWDALVIGAGPAGAVTARELAIRGFRVLMVDKSSFPRAKVCGCCLNVAAINALQRLGLEGTLRGSIPLEKLTLATPRTSANLDLPGGVALSRELFDSRLIHEAVRAGVEFRPNTPITLSNTRVNTESKFPARLTIIATGLLGSDTPAQHGSRIGAGTMVWASQTPSFYQRGTIYMATGRGGYVGLVRVEDNRLDVAAALDRGAVRSSGGLAQATRAIIENVGWPIPDNWGQLAWKGTPALTRRAARLWDERVFRVGDSAGYIEPFTGEGIAWATMAASALAPTAAQAIEQWSDKLGAGWEANFHRVIGQRQRTCRFIMRLLRSPILTELAVRFLRWAPSVSWPFLFSINRPAPLAPESPA
jgi:flavin-dependent dehydrogenase